MVATVLTLLDLGYCLQSHIIDIPSAGTHVKAYILDQHNVVELPVPTSSPSSV